MSNFTGVTFAQQKVLPSDDAIIRRASLSDGILYGCEVSYSGSTLTMGAGQLLVCGRQIRHPAAQNWAVVDATSGFARLVLTVDLTKTSSKDTFEQVVDSIEYAASQNGFLELVQENVNVSGTRYQVVACVVSLGTGGITGIVDQIGAVEASGGGGGLNFSVVGGLTQPADPKENTIWVETNVDITSWIFSATEPEAPADGKDGPVWITSGTSSPVEFNALKKNGIQVYPLSAKQYVSGAWVDKTAKIYQGGEWVEWIPTNYLFKAGFGALVEFNVGNESYATLPIIGKNAIIFTQSTHSGDGDYAYIITKEPIDVTDISVFYIRATVTANKPLRCGTSASNSKPVSAPTDGEVDMRTAGVEKVYEYPVTNISGMRYFKITGSNGATITDIWWE